MQSFAALDEYSVLGGFTRSRHERGGRCKPQSARTGNDKHADGDIYRERERFADYEPHDKRDERDTYNHGNENTRNLIRKFCYGDFCGVRVFDEFHYFIKSRVLADGNGFGCSVAARKNGTRNEFVPDFLIHGNAFARYRRLIQPAAARFDDTIARNTVAVLQNYGVALFKLGDFYFLFLSVYKHNGGIGSKPQKFFNRTHRLVFGLLFEEFPYGYKR